MPWDGALFAADYVRGCIWSFLAGRDGSPRLDTAETFHAGALLPVELVSAPDGLHYPDVWGGAVHRISYDGPPSR